MSNANERVRALSETRARVWSEAEGFLADLKGEEMSVEQAEQWTRYNERIDALANEIEQIHSARPTSAKPPRSAKLRRRRSVTRKPRSAPSR